MPGPFDITAATNTIRLDAQRRGAAAFTVFNNSGRALRGRALVVPASPAITPWLTLDGANERDFAVAATQQFTVQIAASPDAAPGVYTFRLDALDVALPDEGLTTGPSVNFEVPAPPPPPPPPPKIPWWIWLVIGGVVLLIIIAVVAFLLLRKPDSARFDGQWATNFGTLTLTHNGDKLEGTFHNGFDNSDGSLTGSVSGNVFNGSWLGNGSGALQMTLSADGNTLDGRRNGLNKWCGARAGIPFQPGCSFAGDWMTQTSPGYQFPMSLSRVGITVTGAYTFPGGTGTVVGTITYNGNGDAQLDGNWTQAPYGTGAFRHFLLSWDALQFQGNSQGALPWCGWRPGGSPPGVCLRSSPATGPEAPGQPGPGLPP